MKNILIRSADDLTPEIKKAFVDFFLYVHLKGENIDKKTLNRLSQHSCRAKKVLRMADIEKLYWDDLPLEDFAIVRHDNTLCIHYYGKRETANERLIHCMKVLIGSIPKKEMEKKDDI